MERLFRHEKQRVILFYKSRFVSSVRFVMSTSVYAGSSLIGDPFSEN
jgi:hypothetical protein